jgi:hypothetical protein
MATRDPDFLPGSWNPFPSNLPMAWNIFRWWRWRRVTRFWRWIVSYLGWLGIEAMGHQT